jgi:thiamine-monophosphate kinase
MKTEKLGEFGLIEKIIDEIERVKPGEWNNLISGIGDDTAVLRCRSKYQLATTDCLIENIHFKREFLDWEGLGWKALAVNLSDIAAMGGEPVYALVSLSLPPDTEAKDVVKFYKSMLELAKESGTIIAGGNISRSSGIAVHVTVIGEAQSKSKVLLRSKARKGDLIAVTGRLGAAGAGLQTLEGSLTPNRKDTEALKKAFWHPQPRLDIGRCLIKHGIKCGIDVSDGLLSDLGHILEMSKVGARIETARIPVHPSVAAACGADALQLALSGGEDYELLFTGKADAVEKVAAELGGSETRPYGVTIIGEITRGGKMEVVDAGGNIMPIASVGWRHFQVG